MPSDNVDTEKKKAAAKPKPRKTAETSRAAATRPAKAAATEVKPKRTAQATTTEAKPKRATKAAGGTSRKAVTIDPELRQKLITETAHFLSQKRCHGGGHLDDWLHAEQLVDRLSASLG